MNQTLALLYDAYREMNAKRMFWISLIISGVVVLSFMAIGVNDHGYLTLFGMRLSLPLLFSKTELYKLAFTNLGIGLWLTLVGMALALISTAGIFPELITGGSIDLYLSKPISRLRLFITKYVTGLLFVALQVTVFCTASFLVFGLKAGMWEPSIFLGIPVVVCFFSYLYCICVLFGLLTRSTLAAVLLTVLFWFVLWGVDRGEIISLLGELHGQQQIDASEQLIKQQRGSYHFLAERVSVVEPTTREVRSLEEHRDALAKTETEQAELRSSTNLIGVWHRVFYRIKTVLPKTRETNELLDRYLLSSDELADYDAHRGPGGKWRKNPIPKGSKTDGPAWTDPEAIREAQAEMCARPITWVIGTSLLFEGIVLSLAAWIFCRRDY